MTRTPFQVIIIISCSESDPFFPQWGSSHADTYGTNRARCFPKRFMYEYLKEKFKKMLNSECVSINWKHFWVEHRLWHILISNPRHKSLIVSLQGHTCWSPVCGLISRKTWNLSIRFSFTRAMSYSGYWCRWTWLWNIKKSCIIGFWRNWCYRYGHNWFVKLE